MSKRKTATYSVEFKQSSAKLAVDSDQSIVKTAKDLGVNETTLYGWVSKYCPKRNMQNPNESLSTSEELCRLRKENARLKQERDILKKAAAYFAREM